MNDQDAPSLDDPNSEVRALAVSVAFCHFMQEMSAKHPSVTVGEQLLGVVRALGTLSPDSLDTVTAGFLEGVEASVMARSVFEDLSKKMSR
jgi:hypothetical protein